MIKAIFFDIDGTLVNSSSKAHETTRAAIQAAQKKGIFCGVATGRGPVKLPQLIDFLDLDMFVTYNGQLVYTKEQDIFAKPFSREVLEEIIDYAEKNRRQIMFGGHNAIEGSASVRMGNSRFIKKYGRSIAKRLPAGLVDKFLKTFIPATHDLRGFAILKEPIYQCVLISPADEKEKLMKALPNCTFQRSNPYSVDVIPKGGSKVQGIEAFIAAVGVELSEVMAFGDNFNDIEMLKSVGIGVAMDNARPEVKEIADFVTHSNEQDGIAFALKHFGIIDGE